ncbi:hypothetical protein ACFFX0_15570 [Citricoccus parietis]|uniref:Uncharacterized protein n=1 Tax=Citricoccus parietis TaxID=592307 RepID=A0ABV5G0T2_9MICC
MAPTAGRRWFRPGNRRWRSWSQARNSRRRPVAFGAPARPPVVVGESVGMLTDLEGTDGAVECPFTGDPALRPGRGGHGV